MNLSLLFVVLWLGAYRATRFILDDTLLSGLREAFYRRFPPEGTNYNLVKRDVTDEGKRVWRAVSMREGDSARAYSKIGDFFYCYWCIGFWISGVVVLIAVQYVSVPLPWAWWPAISTAVGLTARNLDRG